MESLAKEIMAAPDAPADTKHDARFVLLQIGLSQGRATAAVEKDIDAFRHDYPGDPEGIVLKFYFAKGPGIRHDPRKGQGDFQGTGREPDFADCGDGPGAS